MVPIDQSFDGRKEDGGSGTVTQGSGDGVGKKDPLMLRSLRKFTYFVLLSKTMLVLLAQNVKNFEKV